MLALLALPTSSIAAPDDVKAVVYEGTVGTEPIVMKLLEDPSTGMAKLFEVTWLSSRYGLDHGVGFTAASKDRIQMVDSGQESTQWNLTRQADGSWKGTWKQPDGRTLPVVLQHAVLPSLAADASDYLKRARMEQPYVYLRQRNLKLEPGRREDFMGYSLQWLREPRSHIEMFQVAEGYPVEQRDRINNVLMDVMWSEVNNYYECGSTSSTGGSVEFAATPMLLSGSVVSIETIGEDYCGGAHPDTGYAAINLDAHTGKALVLGDVIELGDKRPVGYAPVSGQAGGDSDAANGERFERDMAQ